MTIQVTFFYVGFNCYRLRRRYLKNIVVLVSDTGLQRCFNIHACFLSGALLLNGNIGIGFLLIVRTVKTLNEHFFDYHTIISITSILTKNPTLNRGLKKAS